MLMSNPANIVGVLVTFVVMMIIGYAVSNFEIMIGPLIQLQDELKFSFYFLFVAFGITQ